MSLGLRLRNEGVSKTAEVGKMAGIAYSAQILTPFLRPSVTHLCTDFAFGCHGLFESLSDDDVQSEHHGLDVLLPLHGSGEWPSSSTYAPSEAAPPPPPRHAPMVLTHSGRHGRASSRPWQCGQYQSFSSERPQSLPARRCWVVLTTSMPRFSACRKTRVARSERDSRVIIILGKDPNAEVPLQAPRRHSSEMPVTAPFPSRRR